MTVFVIGFACGAFVLLSAVIGVSACMLSSRRSRQLEREQAWAAMPMWKKVSGRF